MKQEDIMQLEAAIAADYGNIAGMVVRKDGETTPKNFLKTPAIHARIDKSAMTRA